MKTETVKQQRNCNLTKKVPSLAYRSCFTGKGATAEKIVFFLLWLLPGQRAEIYVFREEIFTIQKKTKNMSKKDDGESFCCYNKVQ